MATDEEKTISVFVIQNWDKSFENAKSRTVNHKAYGQFLLKQGRGYCRLMMSKDGASIYGTFMALAGIVQSKSCPRTGHLTETGDETGYPLSFEDMAAITRIPLKTIERALIVLSSRAVGWIGVDIMRIPRGYHEDTSISSEYAKYTGIVGTVGNVYKSCKPASKSVVVPKIKLPYSSPAFINAWEGLMEVRKIKKAPNTDKAIEGIINKLLKITTTEKGAIFELGRAIQGGWKTVFAQDDKIESNYSNPQPPKPSKILALIHNPDKPSRPDQKQFDSVEKRNDYMTTNNLTEQGGIWR